MTCIIFPTPEDYYYLSLKTRVVGIGRWIWIDLFDKMSHALEMKQKSGSGDKGDMSISGVALKRMHSMQVKAVAFCRAPPLVVTITR